ncbi:amino acid permease [Pseudomonas syringae]|uniref:amino acid permease n=1 Tax=Pseudomonas syringae TaxID=317 RepID=UPI001F2FA864|nr:amino acid permease [Pseudomonas syringae]
MTKQELERGMMSRTENNETAMRRNLSRRHIQMIGLGGAIGTGLFLGSAGILKSAGPAAIVGFAIAGIVAFWIMRQLGEMLVDEPVSASLSHFSNKYCGSFFGYLAGWNCAAMYILVGMAELTAIGKYINYWYPDIPLWMSASVFFIFINLVNLLNVRVFGEMEFVFSLVKVVAIVLMIGFGVYILVAGTEPSASVSNLWSHGGFMPNGVNGLLMALPFIMFAFGGLEMVGFTAGEAKNPETTIPRAINQVLLRIAIFYIGAFLVLLSLTPWDELVQSLSSAGDPYSASPFVRSLNLLGSDNAANLLNFVVLIAALSVYNGVVYCSTRQIHGLAVQGKASAKLLKLNSNNIPINALGLTAVVTVITVAINFAYPHGTFEMLMALAVAANIVNWVLISVTHLVFRRKLAQVQKKSVFASPFYPITNYLCILFLLGIMVIMATMPSVSMSVYMCPVWIAVLYVFYRRNASHHRPLAPIAPDTNLMDKKA